MAILSHGFGSFLELTDSPTSYTGEALKVVRVNAAATGLEFATVSGASPLTTKGDVYTYDTDNARLAVGTDGYVLTADSAEATGLKWIAASGTGDVVGPISATNNAIARFDATTGKLLQNSGVTIDDSNIVTGAGVNITGLTASEIIITDGSKNLASAAVATYPSLTELAYVKGVTSAIQTQIDAKGAGDALVANPLSQFATTTSAQFAGVISDETGTGSVVLATSPTLVTPILGTPTSGVATNLTGTASGLTAGSVTTNANLTGHITSTGNATVLGSFTSAQLATALTDETGTGANVFAATPTFTGTVNAAAITATGVVTGLTLEATGDTAAADNAAMGYTATEGLILTGQGSTNDVTIKNDADTTVISIATGTTTTDLAGTLDMNNQNIDNVKTASFNGEVDDGNSSTADTIDFTAGNNHKSTMTGNCVYSFTAPAGPASLVLKLVQDGTGSRTATWPAAVDWADATAPTLTTTASATDIVTFYFDGTTYYGAWLGAFG